MKARHFSPVWHLPVLVFSLKGWKHNILVVPECRKYKVDIYLDSLPSLMFSFNVFVMKYMNLIMHNGWMMHLVFSKIFTLEKHQDNEAPFLNSYENDLGVRWKPNNNEASSTVVPEHWWKHTFTFCFHSTAMVTELSCKSDGLQWLQTDCGIMWIFFVDD